ncbi:MAG: hypothetical protein BM560_02330 [Roseobacter sp. MedPE-SWde]|uniref:hypothetical protein n=1 Tax=Roseobacter sp. MED193 TaxID=314262 RepID=UPI000068AD48|nr:hypothetical protein [Roseobacter sp. MED193]EAQ45203.1 hypothetical protein MED193_05216 [Roseobacter sp. MED193]OIQ43035.1 MAG: hypothetical protein BM560_02330 [Roseobacter sp. MedPE-SWde]
MSDTDSFIEEVTEEVRRDRLFVMLKRYGWIGGLAVVLIVGGAAFSEYNKAKDLAAAQTLGDEMIAALSSDEGQPRAEALNEISAKTPGGAAVLAMLQAGALADAGQPEEAVARLQTVALDGDLPLIYRHIASFKALGLQQDSLSTAERRLQFDALAQPGAPLALLAAEQIALLDIEEGNAEAAIDRLKAIVEDAGVTADLKERATQVIVALGGALDEAVVSEG